MFLTIFHVFTILSIDEPTNTDHNMYFYGFPSKHSLFYCATRFVCVCVRVWLLWNEIRIVIGFHESIVSVGNETCHRWRQQWARMRDTKSKIKKESNVSTNNNNNKIHNQYSNGYSKHVFIAPCAAMILFLFRNCVDRSEEMDTYAIKILIFSLIEFGGSISQTLTDTADVGVHWTV